MAPWSESPYWRGGRDYGTSRKQKRNGSDSGDSWNENLRGIAHGNRDLLRLCRVCVGLRSSLVDYSIVRALEEVRLGLRCVVLIRLVVINRVNRPLAPFRAEMFLRVL